MVRPLSAYLVVAALFAPWFAPVRAQNPTAETGKTSDPMAPAEPKARPTLDKMKLPAGAVVVLVDEIKEALSLVPKMILMTPEEYQRLTSRLAFLEKQLKAEKTVHACSWRGGCKAISWCSRRTLFFTTDQPWTTIALGLQGAYLTDEGDLDRQVPLLDFGDDGFLLKVEREGTHRLALNLRVPVNFKRPTAAGGGGERA